MIEINLIPDVKLELLRAQRQRTVVVSFAILTAIVSVGVVVLLAVYVYGAQTLVNALADGAIERNDEKLSEIEDVSKTLTIQNQLTQIGAINDKKQMTSRIYDVLNAIVPPAPNNVTISSLRIITDDEQTVKIEGQAANGYQAVELFKKMIDGAELGYTDKNGDRKTVKLADKISVSETSYGEDATGVKVLRFTLSFVYVPELLSFDATNIQVAITTSGNVTDSYLGVPQSIFADRAEDITGEE